MTEKNTAIGVIGLGVMGSSMARNLAKGGYRVLACSRTQSKAEALQADGIIPSSLRELASQCPVVVLSVTDGAAVEGLLFGENGIANHLQTNSLIIDTTTIAPGEAAGVAARCAELGIRFLDAPVTGGDVGARNATLTIMCGGTAESFQAAQPVLKLLGKKVVHVGESGAGQMMKAVNQVAIGLGIVAMTEALLLAESHGLDPAMALDILQGGAAGSWALSNYAPRLLAGDLKPGFDAAHMLKDLKIALEAASGRCDLPGLATAAALFEKLVATRSGVGNHALMEAYR